VKHIRNIGGEFVCSFRAGFAATPEGQKDFLYKVATIAGSVQETCDQAGIVALLRTKSEYKHHEVSFFHDSQGVPKKGHAHTHSGPIEKKTDEIRVQVAHMRNCNSVYEAFQPELWRFGIVQHSERGWYHLDAEAEHVMRADGVQPDT